MSANQPPRRDPPSYREVYGLTHCGRCGRDETPLYWIEELPLSEPAHWFCQQCWAAWDEGGDDGRPGVSDT